MIQWNAVKPDAAPRDLVSVLSALSLTDAIALTRILLDRPLILMADKAREVIRSHVIQRDEESGGLLLGLAAIPPGSAASPLHPVVYITESVPSQEYEGTSVSLQMHGSVWTSALPHKQAGLLIVGWFHSHPNLGAFFSATDRRTQQNFFHHDYSVGYVIDPVRDDHAWFIGPQSAEVHAPQAIGLESTQSVLAAFHG
jgi:proteasome lid subunit RPN8/RPN11